MDPYFSSTISFDDNRILDEDGNAIMMGWEDPIMKDAAEIICKNGGKILNVGFGMGLIDNYIQSHNPEEHWIIEAHPQIIEKMKSEGWDKKPNVNCIFDKWQNVYKNLPKFDGIYFDTWAEYRNEFTNYALNILNPNGIFTFFNNINEKALWEKKNVSVKTKITNLNNIDLNQSNDGTFYWDPNETKYTHLIIIKNE